MKKLNKYDEQRPFTAPFTGPSAVINVLDVDDDQAFSLRHTNVTHEQNEAEQAFSCSYHAWFTPPPLVAHSATRRLLALSTTRRC